MRDTIPIEIKNIIDNVAEQKKIVNYDIKLKGCNEKGEGYLGEVIFLQLQNLDNKKSYDLVLKRAFTDKAVRENAPIRQCFLNEIFFYKTIWPTLETLQKIHGVKNTFDNITNCFYCSTEESNEYLVLENLKLLDFNVYDRMKIVSYEQYEYLFKIYGRLHGLSSVLRKQNKEEFQKIDSELTCVFKKFMETEFLVDMFESICRNSRDKLIPGIDDKVIKAYENYYENGLEIFKSSLTYKGNYPMILHGDCWSNNIMIKFDDKKQISDVRLIDWQMSYINSAVCDLSYLLYSGASKDTYDRLDDLLKIYYDSFSKIVKECNEDAKELYPFEALKAEWKEYASFGVIFSFILIKSKLTKQEDVVDLVDLTSSEDKESITDKYMTAPVCKSYDGRIRDLILHAYEIGIL